MGSPIVVEVKGLDGYSIEEVVELAAVAEKFSEHAIAKAIMQKAEDLGLNVNDPDNFELRMGHGVIAINDNKRIIVGNKRLLEENDILLKESLRNL